MSEEWNEDGRLDGFHAPSTSDAAEESFTMSDDVKNGTEKAPSMHDPKALEAHIAAGHELIPLRRWNARGAKGKPIGKAPLLTDWRRTPPLTLDRAVEHMSKDSNIGVRLRDVDFVIDVDPRNFVDGIDSYRKLVKDFNLAEAPQVNTGGGGWHYYYKIPAGTRTKEGLEGYPGIDFKSIGGQVVAAGSVHHSATRYCLDADVLALPLSWAPQLPAEFLDAIRLARPASTPCSGAVDEECLANWLSFIDVADFRDELKWRQLMRASHQATGGSGLNAFLAWSTSDPRYADHGDIITRRWNSLKRKSGEITARTLIAALPREKRGEATELLNRSLAQDDFPDDVDLQRAEHSREVWDDWVWVADAERFIRRSGIKKLSKEQWKSLYAGLKPDGDVLSAIWKGNVPVRRFETLVYQPGQEEFPDGEQGRRYNVWRNSGVEAEEGDVSVFLDHMAYLFPDETDRDYVLDYLALIVQRPAEKIHFALLVRGAQGTGKSWIGKLMKQIVGTRNTIEPSNDEVISRWTVWMGAKQLAIIEELMTVGRLDVANRLKTVITEPFLRIEEKNCPLYSIENFLNIICFTNHEDALPIEHGDRRWLVVFSPAQKRDDAYYETLFGYLDQGGAAFVKDWLAKRKVALKPRGVAPTTRGKELMRRSSMGDAESHLLELFESGEAPFDFDLVRLEDVINAVPSVLQGHGKVRHRALRFLKSEINAVNHLRYTKGDRGRTAVQLWSVRRHDYWHEAGAAGRIDAFLQHHSGLIVDKP